MERLGRIVPAMFLILGTAFSAKAADYEGLRKKLEAKVRSAGVPESQFSLYITAGEPQADVVFDLNGGKMMIPASISKLATSSAVLATFLPGTKFKTGLWTEGEVKSGVLKGDLYLKGGGDPSFTSESMWFLVNHFLRTGVQKIEGDLVVDDKLFDNVRFDETREDVRVDRAYDAPVGAMSFNWNSVNIFVRPGKAGESARVYLDPENAYTRLVNKTKTVKGSANTIVVDRDSTADGDVLKVSGHIGSEREEVVVYKNITKPDLWSGTQLKSFLSQRGVTVTGKIRTGAVPGAARLVGEAESKGIENILADMNKFSNNYVAEMLTKNIAAQTAKPATLAQGLVKINAHLKDIGLADGEYVFKNPSGLTRDNRFSAKAMWKILDHLREDFRVQPELLTSLPIAGVDGTLKKRMAGTKAERWVRAKTGLLTGVTALAGYAGRKDGLVFTFAFIHNGSGDESRMRRLFDELLVTLID